MIIMLIVFVFVLLYCTVRWDISHINHYLFVQFIVYTIPHRFLFYLIFFFKKKKKLLQQHPL